MLTQKMCKPSLTFVSILIIVSLFLTAVSSISNAQAKKSKAETIKSCELELVQAKEALAICENRILSADSLMKAGQEIIKEANNRLKLLSNETKVVEKEYAIARKPLEKKMNSNYKKDVDNAKAELAEVELRFKPQFRDLSSKSKSATKDNDNGIFMVDKGKTRMTEEKKKLDGLKSKVNVAQEKLNKAKGA